MYVYVCVISEVKRGRDGLLAVSPIGALDWLISGPEAWILHSTAHLEEDFNLSMRKRPPCVSVFMCVCLCLSLSLSQLSLHLHPHSISFSLLCRLSSSLHVSLIFHSL